MLDILKINDLENKLRVFNSFFETKSIPNERDIQKSTTGTKTYAMFLSLGLTVNRNNTKDEKVEKLIKNRFLSFTINIVPK